MNETASEATPDDIEEAPATVFLVDDHEVELDLMKRWCERAGFQTQAFDQAEKLLQAIQHDTLGCVVADLRMPEISGLQLLGKMAERDLTVPVILVTGHGDAENCRAAFQQGVFDFIEKGFDSIQFTEAIARAIRKCKKEQFRHQVRRQALTSLERISPRENEVLMLLAEGQSLKSIAQQLEISVQTASKHRTSIFTKLRVDNEVDLYKLLLAADVDLGE